MKHRVTMISVLTISLLFAGNVLLSQEAKAQDSQVKDIALYGEIQEVDLPSNSLTIQYYDYDTDEEKSVQIAIDKDTKIQNVSSISDVRKNDWAEVTYVVYDGKNIAKEIILEKEEDLSSESGEGTMPVEQIEE